ncbi:MAG: hypothetical protein BMS9Abin06_1083 [Gammaproteobacteria bacterium]|nr:MAG: hypothetical protein BMS9Abin06_1083 [Gammaproteobacteria bacterium]
MRSEGLAQIGILPVPTVRANYLTPCCNRCQAGYALLKPCNGSVDLHRVVSGLASHACAPTSGNPVLVRANMVHQPGPLTIWIIAFVN